MYITCKKCKYYHDGECDFYDMGSGNEINMPCYEEKELIKEALIKNVLQYTLNQYTKGYGIGKNDVLDKLRAKIDKIYKREGISFDCLDALDELDEFIDKYKAESEDKA